MQCVIPWVFTGVFSCMSAYLVTVERNRYEARYEDLRSITRRFLEHKGISTKEFASFAHMRDWTPAQVDNARAGGVPLDKLFPWPEHHLDK
jgi:hypothetical protein